VWDAVEHLQQVLVNAEWHDVRFHRKAAVT